ncbi:HAD family hydrolase [Streptomyces alfalfae]|uniref:HAD family hydrolase n=1 Tax=Streptomyces alfalfae TaxID=1642299 RepID=A0A7T4PGZ2_9ACTN|nr:HAD family hydrolase [Streptomyces alfalfae]QQC90097.1 HAD family hydrolase [Streptomyces alfalfae]QUI32511.1 HAD family hydrolase [Streptomyces alfalfae]
MTLQKPEDGDSPDGDVLPRLLARSEALLFDFDGPVTRFFADYPTAPVADEMKDLLADRRVRLPPAVEAYQDSHGLLHLLRSEVFPEDRPDAETQKTLELVESIVTAHEYRAVQKARPEDGIASLLTALHGRGKRLVVVSNNAEGPVRAFLDVAGLTHRFEGVFGRDPHELRHMKPHPRCVEMAIGFLGLSPEACLLVGDQLTDLEAAHQAGVPFLGYARNTAVARRMRAERAAWAGTSLRPVLAAAEALPAAPRTLPPHGS